MSYDLISRQAAIKDAESWVSVDEYEKHLQKNVVEWLKEFPSAELGTDCINRQAAIDAFEKELSAKYNRREFAIGFVGVENILRDLPSAQPVRKTGKWIKDAHGIPICSECGFSAPFMEKGSFFKRRIEIIPSRYCWQCGAKMEDVECKI